jgi:hypothetical protein
METQAGTTRVMYKLMKHNGVMATPAELLQMTDEELKAYIPTKYMRAGQPGGISITQALKEQHCKQR